MNTGGTYNLMKVEEAIKKYRSKGLEAEVWDWDGKKLLAVNHPKYGFTIKLLEVDGGEVDFEEVTEDELFVSIEAFCKKYCPGSEPKVVTEGPAAWDFITCECRGVHLESCICTNDLRVYKDGGADWVLEALGEPDHDYGDFYCYGAKTVKQKCFHHNGS